MKHTRSLFFAAAAAMTIPAPGATYQWDANGATAGLGGDGAWTGAFWDLVGAGADDGSAATAAVANWNPATAADAVTFGGTAGTVSLASPVKVTGTTFTTAGYTLNLSGTTATTYALGTLSGNATINTTLAAGPASNTTLGFATTNWTGFTGTLNIGSGSQSAGSGKAAIGATANGLTAAATVNVAVNSTLYISGATTHAAAITLAGGDTGESLGQLRLDAGTWSGAITLAGNITGAGDSFIGGSSGTATISGVIGESGGPREFSKGGASTLILSGANTYTGGTRILGGTLQFANASALSSGTLTFAGSAATFNAANTAAMTIANNIQLGAPGASTNYTLLKNSAGATTGTQLNLTGVISGGGANAVLFLNSSVSGDNSTTYRLAGANTFAGTVNVNRGGLILSGASSLGAGTNRLILNTNDNTTLGALRLESAMTLLNPITLQASATVATGSANSTLAGAISGGGALGKIGGGTLTLSGANTYTGATTVSAGTLALDYTTDNTAKISPNLTLAGGALQLIGNATADTTQTLSALTLSNNAALTLATQAGRTLTLDNAAGAFTRGANTLAITTTGTGMAALKLAGTTADSVLNWASWNDSFARTDATNTVGGGATATTVDLSSWTSGATQYVTAGAAFTGSVGTGVAIDGVTFKDAAARTVTIGSANTLVANAGILVTSAVGANASLITGGTLSGSASGTLSFLNHNTAGALTIASALADNGGATAIVKNGGGTVILNRDNNSLLSGPVTVNSGELQALVSTAAGAKSTLGTGAVTVNTGATLRLKTGSTANAMSFANAINLNGATFINEDGVMTVGGALTTTGNSTINGIYGGKNVTFSGATAVNSGTLNVNGFANTTFGTINIAAGATLSAQANTTLGVVTGGGTLQLNSNSAGMTITGDNSAAGYTGNIVMTAPNGAAGSFTINAGAKLVTTGTFLENWGKTNTINGTLSTGTMTLSTAATTPLQGSGTVNIAGLINQNVSNTVVTVSNFNVGAGGITITNGSVRFGATTVGALANWSSAGALGLTAATTTRFDTTGGNITLSGVLGGGTTGAVQKIGNGTLTLSGANTYSGGTTLTAGTLTAGHASALGTGAVAVNGGTLNLGAFAVTNAITVNGGALTGSNTATSATFAGSGAISGTFGTVATGSDALRAINTAGGLTVGSLGGQATFSGGRVTVTGAHNPGNSPGTQTFADGLTYGDGAVVNLEIAADGSGADALVVTNGLTLNGTVTLNLALFGSADYTTAFWDSARTFSLITADTTTGSFTLGGLGALGDTAGEGSWTLNQSLTGVTASWSAIPEPSTYGLLGAGALAGIALVRRRRRA